MLQHWLSWVASILFGAALFFLIREPQIPNFSKHSEI